MPLQPGAIVGGYRVVRVLGVGGMGTVYLARNPILPRHDALKVLDSDLSTDTEFRMRFEREANLAAGLNHPNIVAVYSRGEEDGKLWIAMQYIEGTDAAQELARGAAAMPPPRALRIIAEVGKGLDYAHRRNLLHRDIKPANFLLSREDGEEDERVLLTDFGVAKSAEDGQDLTETGNFMATVPYASPEQLLGMPLDHRADIYSLGCAFYKLLTGQNPYPATVPALVMMGHIHEPPPRPSTVRPELPPALDAVFARVLAKNPAQRYGSCREFVHDAEVALYGHATNPPGLWTDPRNHIQPPVDPPPLPRPPADRGSRTSRLRRISLIGVLALVVGLVVAAGGYFLVTNLNGSGSGDQVARVRAEHPAFEGKSIAVFNLTDTDMSVVLDPSEQAKFLQAIGFRYSSEYRTTTGEKSPRQLTLTSGVLLTPVDIVMVLRTDKDAGNGGLRGLPSGLLHSSTTIAVIDDPSAVQAFQIWTDQSTDTAIAKIVPMLARVVK
ncbi:serine/threonine-protein kinase [Nocardia sp. NPDC052566]|uniref:serine/threonine-protein kinase n=1 Tax=Nocardia sp. NPDC052566 TaxID=3364330 RepID=UPI0037C9F6E1